jgi:hypothetical protein
MGIHYPRVVQDHTAGKRSRANKCKVVTSLLAASGLLLRLDHLLDNLGLLNQESAENPV